VLRQKWTRSRVEMGFANIPACLIGMEACVGAHHLGRRLRAARTRRSADASDVCAPLFEGTQETTFATRKQSRQRSSHDIAVHPSEARTARLFVVRVELVRGAPLCARPGGLLSAPLSFLHEMLYVASLDLICAHHLSGHGAAQNISQCRLVRPTSGEQFLRRVSDRQAHRRSIWVSAFH